MPGVSSPWKLLYTWAKDTVILLSLYFKCGKYIFFISDLLSLYFYSVVYSSELSLHIWAIWHEQECDMSLYQHSSQSCLYWAISISFLCHIAFVLSTEYFLNTQKALLWNYFLPPYLRMISYTRLSQRMKEVKQYLCFQTAVPNFLFVMVLNNRFQIFRRAYLDYSSKICCFNKWPIIT